MGLIRDIDDKICLFLNLLHYHLSPIGLKLHTQLDTNCLYYIWKYYIVVCYYLLFLKYPESAAPYFVSETPGILDFKIMFKMAVM